ncbi:saccharopine dehydrogenase NADP-binding domain-containing protein [Naasia sp. SYSU D00057]|uniref:saccharopine dehydrogenase NADP-binding domain-containing protein n=1 Tax=Naasia sp. SYSU D00057 TaxID=2817380 RepID=UPI001B3027D9|nr:saccharopine dehydrogenase NADP-binding domain-containing protein [Naasia sp. SYSU D00057]
MERSRIVLLGSTGYTGRRVLRELLARGDRPTLVGRSPERMTAVAAGLQADLPVVEADVTSEPAMGRILGPGDVVVSTVGPFLKLGSATVTAAARAGASYFDSTGEAAFVRKVFDLGPMAAERGATLVPAFGYDFVPGNLAGALAVEKAGPRARRVEVGYFMSRSGRGDELHYRGTLRDAMTLTSGGTRATVLATASEPALAYRPRVRGGVAQLHEEPGAMRVRRFEFAGVTRAGVSVGGSEHLGLPESYPQLQGVDVFLGWFGRWTRPLQVGIRLAAPVSRTRAMKTLMGRLSERLPGADREPDPGGRSLVLAVARDLGGRKLATVALTGPDPYSLTASLLAWGASYAAAPPAPLLPGAHGPVAAFGLDALRRGAADAGLVEVDEH